jgi:Arc/MetJ-type ribon-helix-helix transcriptional regulator
MNDYSRGNIDFISCASVWHRLGLKGSVHSPQTLTQQHGIPATGYRRCVHPTRQIYSKCLLSPSVVIIFVGVLLLVGGMLVVESAASTHQEYGRRNMAETEKITINLGPVDLGRIDVLVEQGLYSNRTDAIRTGIRNLLDRHDPVIQEVAVRKAFAMGVLGYNQKDLKRWKAEGKKVSLHVIGLLSLSRDIDPELAQQTIESIRVRGVFRASSEVRSALADRID